MLRELLAEFVHGFMGLVAGGFDLYRADLEAAGKQEIYLIVVLAAVGGPGVVAPITDNDNTYNAWTANGKSVIDYIWFSGFDGILYYHTLKDAYGGISLISDHYPISAGLVLKN